MRARVRQSRRLSALAAVAALSLCVAAPSARAVDSQGSTGGVAPRDPGSEDDPAFVALKEAGRVVRTADGTVAIAPLSQALSAAAPASYSLSTTFTGTLREQPGVGTDAAGHSYSDSNYWNFCGPGATAVVLHYWPNIGSTIDNYPAGSFREPHQPTGGPIATTFWNNSNGHAAIIAIAETWVQPPVSYSWPYTGIVKWEGTYPVGTPINRIRDIINWRANGTLGGFYVISSASSFGSASALHSDIVSDLYNAQVPVVVNVETGNGSVHLPGWTTAKGINHSVSVVGYNDTASTYTIIDTCGSGCENGGGTGGVHTIAQGTLYTLMKAETDGDGIVW